MIVEKITVKDFNSFYKNVTLAYNLSPIKDSEVTSHWDSLNKSNHQWINKISNEVDLIFVSSDSKYKEKENTINLNNKTFKLIYGNDPYSSQQEMKNDYTRNKRILISIDYSEHPVFSIKDNIIFRFVHDYLIHIKGNYSFGRGEINSYNLHAKLAPKDALPALFTEVVGQASAYMVSQEIYKNNGTFPPQKICVLYGFDFVNVGNIIDGKYKYYDIINGQVVEKIKESTISNYRDNNNFKGSDIKYPDNIFQNLQNKNELYTAINFYKKIILLFNKIFKRNLTISSTITDDNFKILIKYENGSLPEYFAYPNGDINNHIVQNYIDKFVPATSLRHELLHEIFEPYIVSYFDLINNLDKSSSKNSIDDVQRDRVDRYTLQSIFLERLVENIERLPDYKDTFPMGSFMIDVINRITKGKNVNEEIDLTEILIKLNNIHIEDKTNNKFLIDTLPKVFKNIGDQKITIKILKSQSEKLGNIFQQYFNIKKNIIERQMEFDVYQYQKLFNEEYSGVIKKINSKEKINSIVDSVIYRLHNKIISD